MIAIHPRRPAAALPLFTLAALLAWSACRSETPEAGDQDRSRFGDAYEVVLGFGPAGPDAPPAVVNDSLVAFVTYAGGCEDHDFRLAAETAGDTTRLRIVHDAHGDTCEELIEDEVRLPLPDRGAEASTLLLLNPHDDTPFVLRWGRAAAE